MITLDETQAGNAIDFDQHQLGWKIVAGVRPVSVIGAEIEYLDFGHPSASVYSQYLGPMAAHLDIRMHGVAAFAVGYLPLPVPLLDVFGKVGVARLLSRVHDTYYGVITEMVPCLGGNLGCGGGTYTQSDNHVALGIGAQIKIPITALRVRAEFERLTAAGEHPNLLSVGLSWQF